MVGRVLIPLAAAMTAVSAWSPTALYCDYEKGFDIKGRDFMNIPGASPDDCCNACRFNASIACSSWTWTNYKNGTCWLKNGADDDDFVVNPNAVSARIIADYLTWGLDSCYLYDSVDFYGNDIGNKKAAKADDCCQICRDTLGCRAYSWNDYQGGTCWLKSKQGKDMRYKPGTKSGNAYSSYTGFRDGGFWALEAGVDYVDHDVAHVSGVPVSQCGDLCSKQANCTVFSWNNYQGGTCWLKSARSATTPNADVTSGVHVQSVNPAHPNY